MPHTFSRRDAIKAAALAAGAAAFAPDAKATVSNTPSVSRLLNNEPRKRVLRVAHFTDIHVEPELRAAEGFAAALHHVQSQKEKPDLIITGGDLVMDSLAVDDARVKLQWELFSKVLKAECSLPIEHTLGNHDIWGWNKTKSKLTGTEAGFGKQRALDHLGLTKPYHSFDRAGWHFICLDSIAPDPNNPDGYIARLDEEQFAWLEGDLAGVKPGTPTMIVSHAPILTVTVLLGAADAKTLKREVSAGLMHADSPRLRTLFAKYPNVKLCLSGHIHRLDRVDFLGVTYFCNGAISGSWWKGPNAETNEGYALVDLYDDGTFVNQYVPYGWVAEKPKK